MFLAKLMIIPRGGIPVQAMFNPKEISLDKSVSWQTENAAKRDVPELQFINGQPRTLTLDLFFDTYDSPVPAPFKMPVPAPFKMDVRVYTEAVFRLALVAKGRPPVCDLYWGRKFFQGVLERVTQRFTLFTEIGTPVRATLSCTFKEWRTNPNDKRQQGTDSSETTRQRTVCSGDSLSGVAGEEYGDPTAWRPIAEANGIDDPTQLEPGSSLSVPPASASGRG